MKPASSDVNKYSQDPEKSHGDESLQPDQSVSCGSLPTEGIIEVAAIIKVTAIEGMTRSPHCIPEEPLPF